MKVDRRKFIQFGAFSGASLVLPDRLKLAAKRRKPWNEQSAKVTKKYRNPRPTACSLCGNRCGMMTYREGDRIVMLLGNREHPVARGKLCAKAYGQLDRMYDPDRQLYPLKRVGLRGGGRWKKITWDEAYRLLAAKLAPVYANEGANLAIVKQDDDLLTGSLVGLFPQAMVVNDSRDFPLRRFRQQLYGCESCRHDFAHCRFVLNFAADPYRTGEAFVSEVQELITGVNENALKLVTIAGRLSQAGGKSYAWHPVHPRQYGDVARAIANVMVTKGWYDRKALAATAISVAELQGYLGGFSPTAVAAATGMTVKAINDLAYQLSHQPAMVIFGREVFAAANGWENACAIELLNILSGAIGRKKGGITMVRPEPGRLNEVSPDWFFQKLEAFNQPRVLLTHNANPAFTAFDGPQPPGLLENEDLISFYVALDTYLNETSIYADLFLPVATELESWGLYEQPLGDGRTCVTLRQPVARPLDEILLLRQARIKKLQLFEPSLAPVASSRDFNQIVLDLGRLLGAEKEPFKHESVVDYLQTRVAAVPGLEDAGGLNLLLKKGFFLTGGSTPPPATKINLALADLGKSAGITEVNYGQDVFYLIPFSWHVLDSQTANSKYLAELRHTNHLWVHNRRARKLGFKEGDEVVVQTAIGNLKVKVWLTEAIHPDCAAIAVGHGHSAIGRVARAETIATTDPMTKALLSRKFFFFTPFTFRLDSWDLKEPVWWHDQGNGTYINALLRSRQNSRVAGLTFIDPLVQVTRS